MDGGSKEEGGGAGMKVYWGEMDTGIQNKLHSENEWAQICVAAKQEETQVAFQVNKRVLNW